MKAIWRDTPLATSDETVVVEGNHYFPANSIDPAFFQKSDHHTVCPWKGEASYYHVTVKGETNQNAAWFYPSTKDAAKNIQGYVAFWKGIRVVP